MEIRIAVAKIDKPGHGNSGDTVETTERPHGGLSIVMADGKINNESNKGISTMVTHRVIDHISQGVRDSAAIRAASSSIYAQHHGNVQAYLNVISTDLQSNTILISRNSPVPVFVITDEEVDCLMSESEPVGSRADVTPSIVELPIKPGMKIVVFSDGVNNAGQKSQIIVDMCSTIKSLVEEQEPTAQEMADFLLNRAIRLDNGHPNDDMSIIVMLVEPRSTDGIRRMNMCMALDAE